MTAVLPSLAYSDNKNANLLYERDLKRLLITEKVLPIYRKMDAVRILFSFFAFRSCVMQIGTMQADILFFMKYIFAILESIHNI